MHECVHACRRFAHKDAKMAGLRHAAPSHRDLRSAQSEELGAARALHLRVEAIGVHAEVRLGALLWATTARDGWRQKPGAEEGEC